jgi:hypothetical protein
VEDADRFRLLGKYRTPRVRVGRFVRCEIRGDVEVTSFTDAPIPWGRKLLAVQGNEAVGCVAEIQKADRISKERAPGA